MRITSLEITNFRAIRHLKVEGLLNAIVIAGPNGCGKSSVFDAIRLLKSAYGEYQQNEFSAFFNEFQINPDRQQGEISKLFHDRSKQLKISATIELADSEHKYISANISDLSSRVRIPRNIPQPLLMPNAPLLNPSSQQAQQAFFQPYISQLEIALAKDLKKSVHLAQITIDNGKPIFIESSPVLEILFGVYRPMHLGVIDYHSASRAYGRENVAGINLQADNRHERSSQHALYNTQNKYQGVKTEMAQSFIRQLVSEKAGGRTKLGFEDLNETLKVLFKTFFPDKTFLGARASTMGNLDFPVKTQGGLEHDIDELSSGEREVLLGYLRLRNLSFRESVLLIDEPELHLNPRLIRGLPRFYREHIGASLHNQIWMITHSDTLLRNAIDEPGYAVFHLQPAHSIGESGNQINLITAHGELQRAMIELVGDLATYSPQSRVVLVEGENSEFDSKFIAELFPDFASVVNVVSAGSKHRVEFLHDVLDRANADGKLNTKFFSITDMDFAETQESSIAQRFRWNVYHIENYLLEPDIISKVLNRLTIGGAAPDELQVLEALRECARRTIDEMVRVQMRAAFNAKMVACLSLGYEPTMPTSEGFHAAGVRSANNLQSLVDSQMDLQNCKLEEDKIRSALELSLCDDTWRSVFRGRNILKMYVSSCDLGIELKYESFRNLVVHEMRESGFRPHGMKNVLDKILVL